MLFRSPDSHGDTSAWNQVLPPMLPTPTASTGGREPPGKTGRKLATVIADAFLPTPQASDADRGGRSDLLTVLRGYETKHAGTLPTPTARDWRSGKASPETHGRNSRPLNETVSAMAGNRSGRMNPRFREWMMSFPIGWTELKPLATRSYRLSSNSSDKP